MKRITAWLLILVMGFGGIPALATTETTTSEALQIADSMPEVGLLKNLGIIAQEADDVNTGMTREDFAVAVAGLLNIHTETSAIRYFSDVEQSGYAVGAINALVDRGILSLADDGKFRPMDIVTAPEAVKMLLCTLGYGDYAELSGGFPNGYLSLAEKLDITDSVSLGTLTKKQAYILLYNALHTEMYTAEGVDQNGNIQYGQDSETLMGKYHDVYRYEGTVTAVYGQNMDTSGMPDADKLAINGIRYTKEEGLDASAFFGNLCRIWFRGNPKEDGGTVIYLCKKNKGAENIIIEPDLYKEYKNDRMTYYISKATRRTKQLKLEAANFVYNGTPLLSNYESVLENINKGSITVKDSDADGVYDLVIIEDYRNFVVGSVNDDTIYNKVNAGESISVSEYQASCIYMAAGRELDYSEIVAGNVLSVAESLDKTAIKIIVSTTEIRGKASSVSQDAEELSIMLEGVQYVFDKSFYQSLLSDDGRLKYNLQSESYYYKLDHLNQICWVDTDTSGMKSGYILKSWQDEPDAEEMPIYVKIFTSANTCEKYECIKNVRVDGVRKRRYSEFTDAFPKTDSEDGISAQFIRYSINGEGKISAIDTGNFVFGAESAESSMIARYDKPRTMWYNSGRLAVGSYIDANTPVFYVPAGVSRPSEEDIYCGAYSFLMINDERYTCNTYRFGSLTMKTGAVVCEYKFSDLPQNRNNGAKVVMIDSVDSGVDSDGNVIQLVDCYSAGAKMELQVPTEISLSGVECGDIVRFYYDINGNVADNVKTGLPDMEIICKRSDIYENQSPGWTNNAKYPNLYSDQTSAELSYYRSSIQFSYGFINKVDGELVGWGYQDGSMVDEIAKISGSIVIYDEKENHKIRIGTVNDISDYMCAGDDCSKIIYHTRSGAYVETFIYR